MFLIERGSLNKKTGAQTREIALGITSRTPQQASPKRVLAVNHGHWSIESVHYGIDWHYDEDRIRSVPATARKTSLACVALRWASSSHSRNPRNPSPR